MPAETLTDVVPPALEPPEVTDDPFALEGVLDIEDTLLGFELALETDELLLKNGSENGKLNPCEERLRLEFDMLEFDRLAELSELCDESEEWLMLESDDDVPVDELSEDMLLLLLRLELMLECEVLAPELSDELLMLERDVLAEELFKL